MKTLFKVFCVYCCLQSGLFTTDLQATTNYSIAWLDDWMAKTNQADFVMHLQGNPDFMYLTANIDVELTGDGELDSILCAAFPNNDDGHQWTFPPYSYTIRGARHLVCQLNYRTSLAENQWRANDATWLFCHEFIAFKTWPTYDSLKIKLTNITLYNSAGTVIETGGQTSLAYYFGPRPEAKVFFSLLGDSEIEDQATQLKVQVRMSHAEYQVAGAQFKVKVPSGLTLSNIVNEERFGNGNWYADFNQSDVDLTHKYYTSVIYSNFPAADNFFPDTDQLLVDLIFNIEDGYLASQNGLHLTISDFVVSSQANEYLPWAIKTGDWDIIIKHPPVREKGDVDNNKLVNLIDAGLAAAHILKKTTLVDMDFWAADMDDNNVIDVIDPVAIANKAGYQLQIQGIKPFGRQAYFKDADMIVVGGNDISSIDYASTNVSIKEWVIDPNGHYLIAIFKERSSGFLNLNPEANLENKGHQFVSIAINDVSDPNSQTLKTWPNPATDQLNIQSCQVIETVKIFNLQGCLLREVAVNQSYLQLDVSNLTTGCYFYEITESTGQITVERLLIAR